MASREPSEDEILQVVDFAGLNPVDDRAMVVQALKDNAFNVESVVMQYFDNPMSFRQKFSRAWNDSMFNADRDGTDNNTGISFHIESIGQNDIIEGVAPPPDGCGPCAPSRPPSRSNNRSPLSRAVEWTAGGGNAGGANSQSREDEDMQRALRESAHEAGIALPTQESGILDATASMPYFGPANRTEYDQDSWAMVPTESKAATAPAPEMRKRAPGAPALLIQGPGFVRGHCLGGLLTILHEIALARNVLLQCGAPAASYGFNSEWWMGQEILTPQVLAQLQSGEMQWDDRHGLTPSCEEEVHRLMAFLDSTERSYGTVGLLTDLIPFPNAGPEKRFYEHLMQGSGDVMGPLTQVASLCSVSGDDAGEEAKFGLLEMEHEKRLYSEIETLYESLDHVMWSDVLCWGDKIEESKMAAFKAMGDVFAFKIGGCGPTASIEIPEEFYPERYLLSRKDEAQRIQRAWCDIKNEVDSTERSEQQLHSWVNDFGQQLGGKKDMMVKAKSQWEAYSASLEGLGRFRGMEESGFDTDKYPDYRAAPCRMTDEELRRQVMVERVVQEVDGALSSIVQKLIAIIDTLKQIRARQRSLSKLLTVPDKPGRPKPMTCKKYLLRGVATPTDIVYVCQRSDAGPEDTGDKAKARDQWWRLAYSPNDEQPVKAEKIEIERVFREMWQETKNPLLVYATEDALSVPRDPLSSPLERFVRADNKAFRQELNRERSEAAEGRRTGAMEAISPSKRKHRSDSADSIDSNRASLGSDDRSGFDNPFEVEEVGSVTEMTDMSGIRRAADEDEGIDMASPEGPDALRPAFPVQPPAQAGNASATLTPSTLEAEDGGLMMGEQGGSRTTGVSWNEDVARPPEMQERCRPPVFMTASTDRTQHEGRQTSMEIPDHQE